MNRRNFLRKIGIGAAAIVAAPVVMSEIPEEKLDDIKPMMEMRGVTADFDSIYNTNLGPKVWGELIRRYDRGIGVHDIHYFVSKP